MSHASTICIMDPDGRFVARVPPRISPSGSRNSSLRPPAPFATVGWFTAGLRSDRYSSVVSPRVPR